MEKRLHQLRQRMHESELKDYVFTTEMKNNVLKEVSAKKLQSKKSLSRFVPVTLSAAFILVFFVGIYQLVFINNENAFPKQATLVYPTYVPENYQHQHVRASGEVYEHLYVNQMNKNEYFTYTMQKQQPDISAAKQPANIPLTTTILGSGYELSPTHHMLVWEDEGYYHIVEHESSLTEREFMKIVHSILEEKGYESYIKDEF